MADRLAQRVLVVCWEGADWRMIHPLMDSGQLPHLRSIVEAGVMGELATLQPQLTPLLWASIATGKRAHQHRILSYADERAGAIRPVSTDSRRAKAIWEILSESGLRTHVLAWPSYPAERVRGTFTSNLFTRYGGDEIHPLYARLPRAVCSTSAAAPFDELRIGPTDLNHEELQFFVPRAEQVDQTRDPGLAILATALAESTSAHAVATWILEHESWDFATVHYELIDLLGHSFMRFHPPKLPGLPHESYEIYQGVMNAVYRYSDLMLGRLLQLAGPETTVIVLSEHGFRCAADRPSSSRPGRNQAAWHSPLGILAMRGPGIRRDEWIWGATLLDICPTVLTLFGLPVGEDMEGQPLRQAFQSEPKVESIASWGEPGTHSNEPGRNASERLSDSEERALLDYLIADGYLEPNQVDGENAAEHAVDARDFNLAQVHFQRGAFADAAALLTALVDRRPGVPRFTLQLAQCKLALEDRAACRRLVEQAIEEGVPPIHGRRLLGQLKLAEGEYEQALEEFFSVEEVAPRETGIHCQIGEVYLAMGRMDEAARAFRKELELDADSALAHSGLGSIALAEERYEEAVESILRSISLWQSQPAAHCKLGIALAKLGRVEDSIRALERSVQLDPRGREAHLQLAERYRQIPGEEAAARHHREQAERTE